MRMVKKISLSIFWFVLISIIASVSSQRCIDTAVFVANSSYGTNRQNILSYLPSNVTTRKGFYNASIGQDSDKVYAMGMCITKNEPTVCSDCIRAASDELKENCPNQIEAYTWRPAPKTLCFVRYSNRSFYGKFDRHPLYMEHNTGDIKSNLTTLKRIWDELMGRVITAASSENDTSFSSHRYYATEVVNLTTFQTMHALMQCTPDLPQGECHQCLQESVAEHDKCCHGKQGGIIAWPSCFFRWDMQPFNGDFDHPSIQKSNKISTVIMVVVIPAVVIISLLSAVVVVLVCRRRKADPPGEISTTSSLQYDLKTIEAATCTFSKSNMLGQGGFGVVFKGVLQDGSEIAVKRLSTESAQGVQEFKNETSLVAKLQHRNLVRVLGFCMEGEEKILIYEFVPNKSLDHFLFEPTKQGQLDWAKRYKIILGTAKGILYLHNDAPLRIIHRDLKASNILLDADMKPKVADFGMARILEIDQSRADTRRVVGTIGYISPEYMMHGQFSMKSDVYSFGVLILEIISGKRNSNFHDIDDSGKNLVTHAWMHWRNGSPLELVDAEMGKNYQCNEVTRCIHIALLCVQTDPKNRPDISLIISMLSSDSTTLPVPQSPVYEGIKMGLPPINSVNISINDSLINDLVPR